MLLNDEKIIDSHDFVSSPLSAFSKTFGLNELKKGYFQHFFNTSENQNYIDPIPDIKYYGVDTMEKTARKKFLNGMLQKLRKTMCLIFKKNVLNTVIWMLIFCAEDA